MSKAPVQMPRAEEARVPRTVPPPLPGASARAAPPGPKAAPATPAGALAQLSHTQLAAAQLLKLQADLNEVRTRAELAYLVANEPRQLMRAQQIAVLVRGRSGNLEVRSVSSIVQFERSSPAILWFESVVKELEREHGLGAECGLKSSAFGGGYEGFGRSYPLGHLLWMPWHDAEGQVFAGMLLARTTPFTESEAALGRHLAGMFSQAWRALSAPGWVKPWVMRLSRRARIGVAVAALVALLFPVPMTALAPVETAPRAPSIVTSGIEGVIQSVLVEPNQAVSQGQVLVRMVDTTLRNRYELAEREVGVAAMKYKKAAQLAFSDSRGRHELAIAQAELELKTAERDYAAEVMARAEIKAERDGIAFYGEKKDLVGKPVAVGEKLMEIASPADIEFRIDLGVADAIVLHDQARVKIFLDSDPLRSIDAKLVRTSYRARMRESQQLAFRLVAEADPAAVSALRLGARGTAQVYSDRVPFIFYLLRRPIAAGRQWLGI